MTDHATIIMESLGRGPQTLPQLACEIHRRGGCATEHMYRDARLILRTLMDADRIEQCGDGLNTCWRLPASTPFEPTKASR